MRYNLAGEIADVIMWLLHLHYAAVASKSQVLRVTSWSKLTSRHLSTLTSFASFQNLYVSKWYICTTGIKKEQGVFYLETQKKEV